MSWISGSSPRLYRRLTGAARRARSSLPLHGSLITSLTLSIHGATLGSGHFSCQPVLPRAVSAHLQPPTTSNVKGVDGLVTGRTGLLPQVPEPQTRRTYTFPPRRADGQTTLARARMGWGGMGWVFGVLVRAPGSYRLSEVLEPSLPSTPVTRPAAPEPVHWLTAQPWLRWNSRTGTSYRSSRCPSPILHPPDPRHHIVISHFAIAGSVFGIFGRS